MNKKGFTLVEILAVVIILSLVMVIVGTKGFGAFDNSKTKITELNQKTIEQGAELLKIDIENCDDDLDEDLVSNLIGDDDVNNNGIPKECSDLHQALLPSKADGTGGLDSVKVDLPKLIDMGYVEGSSLKEIEEKELYEVAFKKDDVNSEIKTETIRNFETKLAILKARKSSSSSENYYDYDTQIVEVKFVKYVSENINELEADGKAWNVADSDSGSNVEVWAWIEGTTDNYTLFIGSETTIFANPDSSNFFRGFTRLKSISFDNFNTENVTDMSAMFFQCKKLTTLNLSNFNTSHVKTMQNMFSLCSELTTLELSNFDTSSVKTMAQIFYGCSKLTTLDLSNFNTENVTDMSAMFYNCSKLTTLDLSNFDTSSVETMSNMFVNCTNLVSLNLSNFDTSNVSYMQYMFYGCKNLMSLDLSNFDNDYVTNMSYMFYNCEKLESLELSDFKTKYVSNMSYMFYGCKNLKSLNLSSFKTNYVRNMSYMFANSKIPELDISNFSFKSITISNMFKGTHGNTGEVSKIYVNSGISSTIESQLEKSAYSDYELIVK